LNHIYTLLKNYKLLISLALLDFKEQFSGSYLGIIWAIIRPLIFISVIWLIFSVGIKGDMIDGEVPFILYLLTGYASWMFFSISLTSIMNAFTGNKSLVKRPSFKIILLPVVKILSSLLLHLVFLGIVVVVMLIMGFYPSIYWLQLPFYIMMLTLLVFGFGLLLASLSVFTKDVTQFVGALLQVGFWVTPIFWSFSRVPEQYLWILNFNPIIYIVNGYRNTFLNHIWFWEDTTFLLPFLIYTTLFMAIGIFIYKKLRPHFGDVL
jgi:ABC-type polysaccharide/polyol phosphate export permease